MDLSLGNSALNGAEAARDIRLQTDSRVIILTSHENYDTVIHASTQALASAYLFKSNFSVSFQRSVKLRAASPRRPS